MADDTDSLGGLPKYPKDAKDLPGDGPGRQSYLLAYVFGATGAGFAYWVLGNDVEAAIALPIAFAAGTVGVGVGYFADRSRWPADRSRR